MPTTAGSEPGMPGMQNAHQKSGVPHLGSKVHDCVHIVLGEQVADQVCALDVTLYQLHSSSEQISARGALQWLPAQSTVKDAKSQ